MSLIKEINLIRGDSSDIYTFSSPDFPDFSEDEWVGRWNIREANIKGNVMKEGTLSKSPDGDMFIFRLLPQQTDNLEPSKYFLTIEIENLEQAFRREIVQCALSIRQDGINTPIAPDDPDEPDTP